MKYCTFWMKLSWNKHNNKNKTCSSKWANRILMVIDQMYSLQHMSLDYPQYAICIHQHYVIASTMQLKLYKLSINVFSYNLLICHHHNVQQTYKNVHRWLWKAFSDSEQWPCIIQLRSSKIMLTPLLKCSYCQYFSADYFFECISLSTQTIR